MYRFAKTITVFALALCLCERIRAQDLEARSYSVVPKGMHAAALSYTFSKGDVVADFTSPVQDLQVTTSIVNLAYVQTFALFNKLARIQAVVPYGFLDGSAKFYGMDTSGSRTGLLDAKIKFGLNLLDLLYFPQRNFDCFRNTPCWVRVLWYQFPADNTFRKN